MSSNINFNLNLNYGKLLVPLPAILIVWSVGTIEEEKAYNQHNSIILYCHLLVLLVVLVPNRLTLIVFG